MRDSVRCGKISCGAQRKRSREVVSLRQGKPSRYVCENEREAWGEFRRGLFLVRRFFRDYAERPSDLFRS